MNMARGKFVVNFIQNNRMIWARNEAAAFCVTDWQSLESL
jgi:hypothetical protein